MAASASDMDLAMSTANRIAFDDDADLGSAAACWGPAWSENCSEAPVLPLWNEVDEQPEHQSAVFCFHTDPCADFHSGYCSFHRPKGKASPCYCYHFESQRRRPPVDVSTGQLLYWDVPCHSLTSETPCPHGNSCIFAHNREEISYHPAKYKTRQCNGHGCRGEAICCFAHSELEMRGWAQDRYSYWSLAIMKSQGQAASGAASAPDWTSKALALPGTAEDWRRPPYLRSQLPPARHKQRFCASFPDVAQCRRGAACAFAHSREEARTPLLTLEQEQQTPAALTEEFFMYQFKTLWCPVGVQHDWQSCVYAHNYQDARRQVSIGYGPRPCPYWAKKDASAEYSQRCPLGLRCPFSHGAKEQLYHPQYFRTVICRDLRSKACPRQKLCAFFHRRAERRKPPPDATNYSVPLKEDVLPEAWVNDFLAPPFRDAASPFGVAEGSELEAMNVSGMGVEEANAYWAACNQNGMLYGEAAYDYMMDNECAPRTQSSSSTSAPGLDPGKRRPGAGAGAVAPCRGGSSSAMGSGSAAASAIGAARPPMRCSPCNPFQGPFDAFPGFLASASGMADQAASAASSTWWSELSPVASAEPQLVS
eukprot:CAMPEP_0170608400 /NCGR_PEP_ID=MMETSP0224-20130122/21564_1 /TAXON_ID=285029 /ORGANISM="Togula jolla, Strain CCCM 725" /LENGTH=592 /DNA_ID=CAMNT_0010933623 /DNA_START=18 /DNA_END=1796 /DNA_ORIENTATION=+